MAIFSDLRLFISPFFPYIILISCVYFLPFDVQHSVTLKNEKLFSYLQQVTRGKIYHSRKTIVKEDLLAVAMAIHTPRGAEGWVLATIQANLI